MRYIFPATDITDLAFALGWNTPMYWETELTWKNNVFEYPDATRRKYKTILDIDESDVTNTMIDNLTDDEVGDLYIQFILRTVPMEERGQVFIEEIKQHAEAYIWEHWTSCLRGHMHAAVTNYIGDTKDQFGPCDAEIPDNIEDMIKDLLLYETTKRTDVPNTYVLISADNNGITNENACSAYSVNEALIAFNYGPGGIENHWENMVDQKIVDADEEFDPEHPAFKERALYMAQCFFGLVDDEHPRDHGNYIDGSSNSSYKLIEITPSGIINSYPK